MLVVSTPPGCEPERRYVLDLVLSERLGLDWQLCTESRSDVRLTMAGDPAARAVVLPDILLSTDAGGWLQPRSMPTLPLRSAPPMDGWPTAVGGRIPVLFGRAEDGLPVVARTGDGVSLAVDVFGSVFFLVTRYEEMVARRRDEYGRVLEDATTTVRSGLYDVPLADLYVELLWHAMTMLWPGIRRRELRYRAILTHDVDLTFACRERMPSVLHSVAADVLKRRDLALALRRLRVKLLGCDEDHSSDPWNVFEFLMSVAERNGLTCVFNVLADSSGPGTSHYTLADPWIRRLLRRAHERGHEIGLHGGFHSHLDPARMTDEFGRLVEAASACGVQQAEWGGRQHFLRWDNPATWRAWDAAGMGYDSTVGFARYVGFRAGTCHPYRAYDLAARRPLRLRERPLIAMDTSWLLYRDASLDEAAELVVDAARTCHRFGGEFVGLFHNSSLASARSCRWYEELVPQIA